MTGVLKPIFDPVTQYGGRPPKPFNYSLVSANPTDLRDTAAGTAVSTAGPPAFMFAQYDMSNPATTTKSGGFYITGIDNEIANGWLTSNADLTVYNATFAVATQNGLDCGYYAPGRWGAGGISGAGFHGDFDPYTDGEPVQAPWTYVVVMRSDDGGAVFNRVIKQNAAYNVDFAGGYLRLNGVNAVLLDTAIHVWWIEWNGASSRIFRDGTLVWSGTTTVAPAEASVSHHYVSSEATISDYGFVGLWCEWWLGSGGIESDGVRNTLVDDLMTKWGV